MLSRTAANLYWIGRYVERATGRPMRVWDGECHVHAGIRPSDIDAKRAEHPDAEFLIHPECGCVTQTMEYVAAGDVDSEGVHMLSTSGMLRHAGEHPDGEFIVATELGILHRLRRENPTKTFFAANDRAQCAYMKVTTLPKVLRSLETLTYEITVPDDVAAKARRSIERMVAIGGQGGGPALSPFRTSDEDPGE